MSHRSLTVILGLKAGLVGGLLLGMLSCTKGQDGTCQIGEAAPRITGKDLAGDYIALADYRGQVVLLNLWATWCAPCRAELPALDTLHRRYHDRGFAVLGISVDSERGEPAVRAMVQELRLSFPIALDPAARAATLCAVDGYPTSLLLGRDGQIRWRRSGSLTASDPEVLAAIDSALAEPPPP